MLVKHVSGVATSLRLMPAEGKPARHAGDVTYAPALIRCYPRAFAFIRVQAFSVALEVGGVVHFLELGHAAALDAQHGLDLER